MAKSILEDAARAGAAKRGRRHLMHWAGAAIIAIGAAAALLPLVEAHDILVGWLLLTGGLLELAAASARRRDEARVTMRTAGAVTVFAGLSFLLDPLLGLYSVIYVVMAWLFVRGAILLIAAANAHGPGRSWALFGGLADAALGLVLLIGLPIAAFVVQLFGPTQELVSRLAFILAISFLTTGISLMALSSRSFDVEPEGAG